MRLIDSSTDRRLRWTERFAAGGESRSRSRIVDASRASVGEQAKTACALTATPEIARSQALCQRPLATQ